MKHTDPTQSGRVLHWTDSLFQTVESQPVALPMLIPAGEAQEVAWSEWEAYAETEAGGL